MLAPFPTNTPQRPADSLSESAVPAWFCVRSQPKHEGIAAARLRQLEAVEVFNPTLRLRRATRRGPVWMIEPLFPGYVFARFTLERQLANVRYASGVADVVSFGGRYPTVTENVIAELRDLMGGELFERSLVDFEVGESVRIARGPFGGIVGTVGAQHDGGIRRTRFGLNGSAARARASLIGF